MVLHLKFNFILGVTLSESNASVTWDRDKEHENDKLIIRQFLLGRQAKEGEFNVVEVHSKTMNKCCKGTVLLIHKKTTFFKLGRNSVKRRGSKNSNCCP